MSRVTLPRAEEIRKRQPGLRYCFYDTATGENPYHGLMLGLTAWLMPACKVKSNGERGEGQFDRRESALQFSLSPIIEGKITRHVE